MLEKSRWSTRLPEYPCRRYWRREQDAKVEALQILEEDGELGVWEGDYWIPLVELRGQWFDIDIPSPENLVEHQEQLLAWRQNCRDVMKGSSSVAVEQERLAKVVRAAREELEELAVDITTHPKVSVRDRAKEVRRIAGTLVWTWGGE